MLRNGFKTKKFVVLGFKSKDLQLGSTGSSWTVVSADVGSVGVSVHAFVEIVFEIGESEMVELICVVFDELDVLIGNALIGECLVSGVGHVAVEDLG